MGYHIEVNCLLVVPSSELVLDSLELHKTYAVSKEGERLYPLNIPLEICDENYKYYGKVAIQKLVLEARQTYLEFRIVKIFNEEESRVFTSNFIKPS